MLAEIVGPERVDGQAHGGVVFCADLVPGKPWVHVPITMGYDRNAELLIDEKRAFLEDKLARNVHLFFTHDPEVALVRSEEHTSELQSLMRNPYAVFCLKTKKNKHNRQ